MEIGKMLPGNAIIALAWQDSRNDLRKDGLTNAEIESLLDERLGKLFEMHGTSSGNEDAKRSDAEESPTGDEETIPPREAATCREEARRERNRDAHTHKSR